MNWDIFHKTELRLEPGLTTGQIRDRLLKGELRNEDLVRPAGTDQPWTKLADMPALVRDMEITGAPDVQVPTPERETMASPLAAVLAEEDEVEDRPPVGTTRPGAARPGAAQALMVDDDEDDDDEEEYDPLAEDEEAADFTLSRSAAETVEELDLAAMVDVAFQMVLFFLVTAATVMYKTLEIPAPNPDSQKSAAAQSRKTMDDLAKEFILVEIDPEGAIQVDRRPVDATELIDRLRQAREETGRSAMLLTADFATPHRNSVLAYDAANEIGLRIAIAKPTKPVAADSKSKKAVPEGG